MSNNAAIDALLAERKRINEALKALGYTEGDEVPKPAATESSDGFLPLRDFGDTPPPMPERATIVTPKVERPEVVETKPDGIPVVVPEGPEPVAVFVDEVPNVDTTVPPPGSNVPDTGKLWTPESPKVDVPVEAVSAEPNYERVWRRLAMNDKQVLVAVAQCKRGNVEAITEEAIRIFGGAAIKPWTVRRAIYGKKATSPDGDSLMARGYVEQVNPYARGKITYQLSEAGRKLVVAGGNTK